MGVSYRVVAKNHRTGEVATRQVTGDDRDFNVVWADLSRKHVIEAGDTLEVALVDQWDNIVSGPFRHQVGVDDLQKAYVSLSLAVGDVHPAETLLGQNFPNPFNPETWIPYQPSEDSAVSISIYDTAGKLVRTLSLGFQSTGFYNSRDRAAYWDGRNNIGERVASGKLLLPVDNTVLPSNAAAGHYKIVVLTQLNTQGFVVGQLIARIYTKLYVRRFTSK